MPRIASVLVCDDVLASLSGKLTASGIYTGDLGIPGTELTLGQLVFFFHIECDLDDPYQSLTVEVSFPGEKEPRRVALPVIIPPATEGRNRWAMKWPFLVQQIVLRPGKLQTKIIHEKGEIDSGGIWIVGNPLPVKPS